MSKRKTYHITKTENGWQGKAEDGQRAIVVGETKAEVLEKMTKIASSQGNTSLKIHKSDGKFQEERTYPKGSDPYPPKG